MTPLVLYIVGALFMVRVAIENIGPMSKKKIVLLIVVSVFWPIVLGLYGIIGGTRMNWLLDWIYTVKR